MSLRSILVHVDDTPGAFARARIAEDLAAAHGAAAAALVIAATPPAPYGPAAAAFAPLRTEVSLRRREAAEGVLRRLAETHKLPASVLDTSTDRLVVDVASRIRSADLAVIAPPRANGGYEDEDVFEAAVFASGRPALVIPPGHDERAVGRTIAIAWKDCREAARAVHDALPLLEKAESVRLTAVHSAEDARFHGGKALERMEAALRAHGVKLGDSVVEPSGARTEAALLSIADTVGADLLVMGAYGRSRMSELLFGGFTQHVIEHATLPLLLSH